MARTPKTVVDPDAIRALFVTIRDEGISICDEEHVTGSTGLAAPIRGRDGMVVAALNLGVVSSRYHLRGPEFIESLKRAASQVSGRLGHIS